LDRDIPKPVTNARRPLFLAGMHLHRNLTIHGDAGQLSMAFQTAGTTDPAGLGYGIVLYRFQ